MPGSRPDLFAKSATYGADAIILDLEDAVLPAAKATALTAVASHLRDASDSTQWWVRIDSADAESQLVTLAALPMLSGIMIPKATAKTIAAADRMLSEAEQVRGTQTNSLRIIALVESARGILELSAMAQRPRVLRFAIGEADLAAELGIELSEERAELWPIRLQVVVASAAVGMPAPIAPVHLVLNDAANLESSTVRLRKLGFRARTALHPQQIAPINQAFSPSADEVASARNILQVFEQAKKNGVAALTDDNGNFIDEALARVARSVLELDALNANR